MPEIVGVIGTQKIADGYEQRYVRRTLAQKLTSDYYHRKNIYISGLKLGTDFCFANLVNFLHLDFHAVLAIEEQVDHYGIPDRAKFNRIINAAHSVYKVYKQKEYKISKKKRRKLKDKYNKYYMIDRIFLQANKFIVNMSSKVIIVWNGKRVGSNTYKTIKYAQEIEKEIDVIQIGSRYKV